MKNSPPINVSTGGAKEPRKWLSAAMKPFNVGIVGYGWAAGAHILAINAGALGRVTKVCSSRQLNPQELSARHGCQIQTYTDLEAMLDAPDLDVVSVCSYHAQHKEHVLAAARAGKHIIAEKPLALSLAEVHEIEAAVRKAGVAFCICFELRFSAQFRAIKSLLDRGWLGTLHYGEVDYYHGIGPWYREFEWCTSRRGCGSSLLEAGCHAMDALLLCLGSDVEEVFSYGSKSASPVFAPYEYPPTTATLVKFKSGRVGKCASVIDCWQPYYFHTHLVGSEGSLLDNRFHSNLVDGLNRNQWNQLAFKPVDSGDVSDHPYQTEFDCFFETIRRGQDMPLAGLADAVRTHEVIFAADQSLQLGRPVKLSEISNPKSQTANPKSPS
jgi:UDP-N-acetyl-2-amino-2-deoxyglucuronate dehydrogenase